MFLIGRLKHLVVILLVVFIVVFFRWNGRISFLEMGVYWLNERVSWIGERTYLPYGDMEEANRRIADLSIDRTRLVYELARVKEEVRRLSFEAGLDQYGGIEKKKELKARVIGRTPGSWHSEVVVDLGRADGVREGFVALAGGGLAGRVIHTTAGNSVVLLITGLDSATSAAVRERSVYGIVRGSGQGTLKMEAVPVHAGVRRGDTVVTSGLGNTYPADLPIGKVSEVKEYEDRLSPGIELDPAADLSDIYYILLVEP